MKIIGVVGRAYYNKDNQKIMQVNEDIRRAFCKYDDVTMIEILPPNDIYYVDTKMGEDKLDNTSLNKLNYILELCDGFIVPGGSYWYNFDEYVIEYAINKNKPLLCICLGFQALCSKYSKDRNKFDMTSSCKDNSHYGDSYSYIHDINILDNTKLKNILKEDNIKVNSIHKSYINTEFNKLVVSAYSSDNIIEAVEIPNLNFVLGVQWHPEYIMDNASIKIFDSFVDSMKK